MSIDSELCYCGKRWGTHIDEFEVHMKPNCVVCGYEIQAQCEELYYIKGNYCSKCNNRCAMAINDHDTYNTKAKDALRALLKLK